jgi:putative transposase
MNPSLASESRDASEGRARPPAAPPPLPIRKTLGHIMPSWVADGSLYFITLCTKSRLTDELIRDGRAKAILDSVCHLHRNQSWFARLVLIMPDHIHGLIAFPREPGMRQRVSSWKGFLAKSEGITWQDRFFDHRLRSDESTDEKASYIRMNPVRAGLVQRPDDWPWIFDGFQFEPGSAGTPRPTYESEYPDTSEGRARPPAEPPTSQTIPTREPATHV